MFEKEYLEAVKFRCKPTQAAKEKALELALGIWDLNDNIFFEDFDVILFVEKTAKFPEGVVKIKLQKKYTREEECIFPDGEGGQIAKNPMKHIPWSHSYDNIFEHGPHKGPETEVWLKGEKKEDD